MDMNDQMIAVFVDQDGRPTDFLTAHELALFARADTWQKVQAFPVVHARMNSVAGTRDEVRTLIRQIAPCSIIAALDLSGIPYAAFDLANFRIFSISDVRDEVLDGILNDISEANETRLSGTQNRQQTTPIETDLAGYYSMDLITLQTTNPDISSKMALADFLEKTPFMELNLRCSHVPPWIEKSGAYTINIKQTGSEITARIQKKLCRE